MNATPAPAYIDEFNKTIEELNAAVMDECDEFTRARKIHAAEGVAWKLVQEAPAFGFSLLGSVHAARGQASKSIAAHQKSLQFAALNNDFILKNFRVSLTRLGRNKEALEVAEKACRQWPTEGAYAAALFCAISAGDTKKYEVLLKEYATRFQGALLPDKTKPLEIELSGVEGHIFSRPLRLEVSFVDSEYIATAELFDELYGCGDSPAEAVGMLGREIVSYWEDLNEDDNFSPSLLEKREQINKMMLQ